MQPLTLRVSFASWNAVRPLKHFPLSRFDVGTINDSNVSAKKSAPKRERNFCFSEVIHSVTERHITDIPDVRAQHPEYLSGPPLGK
jgi:hypothetical protein